MRDGIRLATDLYLPADGPAPAIAVRTPYGRAHYAATYVAFAQSGYVVISQDCRGTGDSEPDNWEFLAHEKEDCADFLEWITRQAWHEGFVGSCGESYNAWMQWYMATDSRMSAVAPQVAGLVTNQPRVHYYNFVHAYSRSVGKGAGKVPVHFSDLERQMVKETLAGGYFNEPLHVPFSAPLLERYPFLQSVSASEGKRWLWAQYNALDSVQRAELLKLAVGGGNVTLASMETIDNIFGYQNFRGAPSVYNGGLARSLHAPALMITGWYDWGLGDVLASWELVGREAHEHVSSRCRLLVTPSAHDTTGYHEGKERAPELERSYRTPDIVDLLLRWYSAVRDDRIGCWPKVIYYLMGANEWQAASEWPPAEAQTRALFLGPAGTLGPSEPRGSSSPDAYTYDPDDPTPTVGGSIVSSVYPPGSIDVSAVQNRADVLIYTTAPLDCELDVVGPLRLILYASSTAVDTDFSARLSDVFPDGRAIQLQTGIVRARYRNPSGEAELLEPTDVYRFDIDMWATANRFKVSHRLRVDISSADFPKFDRNANRGGLPGPPISARQTIFHDSQHPSHLLMAVIGNPSIPE